MKKYYLVLMGILLFSLCSCNRLDQLEWKDMSAQKWLESSSYLPVTLGPLNFILSEPSSTIIVYGLGLVLLIAGVFVIKNRGKSRSKLTWGIALIIWAISTFLAGTSYQALSYELKCAGRSVCLWTTWFEIWYLLLFVLSMNVIIIAVSFSSTQGKARKVLVGYALISTLTYTITVLIGAFKPDQFMASFECMVLFAFPTFIILLAINITRFIRLRKQLDLVLVGAWVLMLLTVVAYFLFYISGYAAILWEKGIWFNANDVLHLTLILWIIYFQFVVLKKIEDAE